MSCQNTVIYSLLAGIQLRDKDRGKVPAVSTLTISAQNPKHQNNTFMILSGNLH